MSTKKKPRVRVALEMDQRLRDQLQAMAKVSDRSLSAVIRQLLTRALAADEKPAA